MSPGKTSTDSLPEQPPHIQERLPTPHQTNTQTRFREFNLQNKVFIVTGYAHGFGLAMSEALVEAGAQVYCLDRLPEPDPEFHLAQKRANPAFGGSLHYLTIDVCDTENVSSTFGDIAAQNGRLDDGLLAAAGVNHAGNALGHTPAEVDQVMSINLYGSIYLCDRSRETNDEILLSKKVLILLVASMSGLIASKGMNSPVYNSSKAAII